MINILSKETIEKIAAGEVAERPSSVIRELIDNAIDSGASSISAEIRDAGLSLIRVSDNGSGIEKADIRNAFKRHATSKIKTADDIEHVLTMGFRGEALSSIAAVSDTELVTRTADSLTGTFYRIKGGAETMLKEVGAPEGTTVAVRDFLYNVPVRKQFLKSPQLENAYSISAVQRLALANPDISFTLRVDGRNIFNTSGNGSLKDIVYVIFGQEAAAGSISFEKSSGGIRVWGLAGTPAISKSRREHEIFIINKRPAGSDILKKALEDAYRPYLMQHRFPFAVVNIELDPSGADVNVHPGKKEIRFRESSVIYDAVYGALSDTLKNRELISDASPSFVLREKGYPEKGSAPGKTGFSGAPGVSAGYKAKKERPAAFFAEPYEINRKYDYAGSIEELSKKSTVKAAAPPESRERGSSGAFINKSSAPYYTFIGQVFGTYWIIEFNDDMYLIDQHAAHEKVNYERFMSLIESHKTESQMLYPPMVITVEPAEAVLLEHSMDEFAELGYEIDYAGDCDFIVRAVPSNLPEIGDEKLLKDLMGSIFEEGKGLESGLLKDRIATMSCKAAVKGSRSLSEMEARALISELLTLENPYFCPHGRPAIIKWSRHELDRLFKRIV